MDVCFTLFFIWIALMVVVCAISGAKASAEKKADMDLLTSHPEAWKVKKEAEREEKDGKSRRAADAAHVGINLARIFLKR